MEWDLALAGLLIGTLVGLTGMGGGSLMTPLLIFGLTSVGTGVFFGLTLLVLFPLRSAIVVGTDIFHAAALLWVAGMGHLVAGNVNLCGRLAGDRLDSG